MAVYDTNLVLRDGSVDLDANEATPTAVDVEGPTGIVELEVIIPTGVSGTTPTLAITFQQSTDGGSNYVQVAAMRSLVGTDAASEHSVYAQLSAPGSGQTRTKLRYTATVGGTTPDFKGVKIIAKPVPGAVGSRASN